MELARRVLPAISELMQSPASMLYTEPGHQFFWHGLQPKQVPTAQKACAARFAETSGGLGSPAAGEPNNDLDLTLHSLTTKGDCLGVLGLVSRSENPTNEITSDVVLLVTDALSRLRERSSMEIRLSHLNTYRTVSSTLAQSFGLQQLLETALYCSMEAVSAETASVLLLDDEKKNFVFYEVEGPTKSVLMGSTFSVDKGIAGDVLRTEKSEVINDVPADPRFYRSIDEKSNFKTRNMMAVPLVAGQERVGVLEVINKAGGDSFSEEEHLLLLSIAEEIAFAIRDAKIFEYVVNSYCKQRQGQSSCKGCQRPLGS